MQTITKTENLIIDLQNNGGGSDESFEKLIPLIYTNPIRVVGMELLSTPLNNKRMEEFANDPEASVDDKKWAREAFDKLNKNLGKFVNLDSSIVDIETSDTMYTYPKKVGIIINGGCGSTTEQFILAAKQSNKVKLFGTTTFGSLDISNMFSVKSPCNDLELGYCLSKSFRIPDFTIDGKGLQPDYYLDEEIPKYEWLDFVNKILSKP
jgi:C-terminal processing protease CtpA/Prc